MTWFEIGLIIAMPLMGLHIAWMIMPRPRQLSVVLPTSDDDPNPFHKEESND